MCECKINCLLVALAVVCSVSAATTATHIQATIIIDYDNLVNKR